jgi:hypothetical protein
MTEPASPPAPRADAPPPQTAVNPIIAKAIKVAERQKRLQVELHQAEVDIALTRARLTLALDRALAGRAEAEMVARQVLIDAHRRASPRRPGVRTRLSDRIDGLLVRLGGPGRVAMIARSGLWSLPAGGLQGRLAGLRAIRAYVRQGPQPGLQPPTIFDHDGYLARYPDVAESGASPLAHYLVSGGRDVRVPHPLFDPVFYLARHGAAVSATGLTPLEHYVRIGASEGFDPHPLFCGDWYVSQRPDLAAAGVNPLAHYLAQGWREGASPHPLFDPAVYLTQAGQTAQDQPALLHYLERGWREGLRPHPLFDPAWYLERYPDVAETGVEPLSHFVMVGGAERRDPSASFSSADYVSAKSGGLAPDANPLIDYLAGGAWGHGAENAGFAPAAYLAAHPEIAESGMTPLEHWARTVQGL